jgi:hypothetical protein
VVATDSYGNDSSALDDAPSDVFTVDSVTDFGDLGTPAALVNAAPAVSFTPPAGKGSRSASSPRAR